MDEEKLWWQKTLDQKKTLEQETKDYLDKGVDKQTAKELAKTKVEAGGDNAVDEDPLTNFTPIRNEVFELGLNVYELCFYFIAKRHTFGKKNFCFPAMSTFCRLMKCSLPTALKARGGLIKCFLLEIAEVGGGRKTNRYRLLDPIKALKRKTAQKN